MGCAIMLAQTSIYARISVEGHTAPWQGRRLGGISVSAAVHKIRSVFAYTASARHVDKVLARKWRPTFFLLSGAKKVGRHKSSQINGLCLEAPAPSTEKWRFCPSKNRHFPPVFSLPIPGAGQPGSRAENREWGQTELMSVNGLPPGQPPFDPPGRRVA